jgi:hypothetical protein
VPRPNGVSRLKSRSLFVSHSGNLHSVVLTNAWASATPLGYSTWGGGRPLLLPQRRSSRRNRVCTGDGSSWRRVARRLPYGYEQQLWKPTTLERALVHVDITEKRVLVFHSIVPYGSRCHHSNVNAEPTTRPRADGLVTPFMQTVAIESKALDRLERARCGCDLAPRRTSCLWQMTRHA